MKNEAILSSFNTLSDDEKIAFLSAFIEVKNEIQEVKNELKDTKNELKNTRSELKNTRNELTDTKKELKLAQEETINLRNRASNLEAETDKLKSEANELKNDILYYKEEIAKYKQMLFGKKSEKVICDNGQLCLFNEIEMSQMVDSFEAEIEKTEIVKEHTRRVKGSKNLVNDDTNLDVEVIDHKLEDLTCSKCGDELKEMGYSTRRELCVKPAQYFIKEHRYYKYSCKKCDNILTVEREITPFPKSMYSSSLVSEFIADKFAFAMPLYRQEKKYHDNGLNITRSNICHYIYKAYDMFKHLYDLYERILKEADIIHADETKIRILSEKNIKGDVKSNYIWLYRTSRSNPKQITFYYSNEGRKYSNVLEFFSNEDESKIKYIHADGYQAYEKVKGYRLVSCFAHARRLFVDVLKNCEVKDSRKYKIANKFIKIIQKLYYFEEGYKKNNLSYDEIKGRRQIDQRPLLDEYKNMLDENFKIVSPKSKLGDAIAYSLNRYNALTVYLEDGRLEIDNNAAERMAKNYAVGRKNWLFCETKEGAKKSALMYTIVQTAIANNLKPRDYIEWLLDNIPTTKVSDIESLAPWSESIPDYLKRDK